MLSIEELTQTPQFSGLDHGAVTELWTLGKDARFGAGETLFDCGSEAGHLLVLQSGAVELFFPVPVLGATKDVIVERVEAGDVLAWSALVGVHALTLSARCVEECTVRRFARDVLRAHLQAHPDVGHVVMRNLAAVIGRRLQNFQDLWIREMQARIVGMLG